MTDRDATSAYGEGTASDEASGENAPTYPPGSRLRRALDLARAAGRAADVPAPTIPRDTPLDAKPAKAPERSSDRIDDSPIPAHRGGSESRADASPPGASPLVTSVETWEEAAQGWVQRADGQLEWRPIVTTVDRLDSWRVDTYVGVVSGTATAVAARTDGAHRMLTREAVARMVAEATARGAHAVLGVRFDHSERDGHPFVTAVGTAVTLAYRREQI